MQAAVRRLIRLAGWILWAGSLGLGVGLGPARPAQAAQTTPVIIYLFWGDGCPHCAAAKPFLQELTRRYPAEVRAYEIWYHPENVPLLEQMAQIRGFEPSGVPTIFIGDRYWVGYNDTIQQEIEATVSACARQGCADAGAGIISPAAEPAAPPETPAPADDPTITLPFFGIIHLNRLSLPVSTALIAFVDGFNPCSLWVLSMLLALVVHTRSRRKTLLIGLIFLTVTAGVYALFMAGVVSLLKYASFLIWIQTAVAVVALGLAAINIKDYFWYKEGVSLTIDDKHKPGIYQNMRRILAASESFWGLVGATVVMSGGVSLVEFSCTAGFPVLWANLLSQHTVTALTFGLLLGLYLLVYQLDELVIFLTAVFTMRAAKVEEKQGRILKLLGGVLMLTLAVVMLADPKLMNQLATSLVVFAIAFGATGLILLVHRVILPRYGIIIGTEDLAAR